MKLLRLLE